MRNPTLAVRPCLLALGLATSLLLGCAALTGPSTAPPATASVDFAALIPGQKSMSGFLHGIGNTNPPDAMILPLQPRLWRATFSGKTDVYARLKALGFGDIYQVLPSDSFRYPGTASWSSSGSRKPPFDLAPYEGGFVRWTELLTNLSQMYPGNHASWDVWNEPNIPFFWYGTPQQYFDTYATAYKTLREKLGPDVAIGGPSTGGYSKAVIEATLDFCLKAGCQLNFLSWHEYPDHNIPVIADHLREARKLFIDNPKYAALGIKEIHINETVGPSAKYRPGEILAYLYYLEVGGADAAARGCWKDSKGVSQCFNNTIGGLLDPTTFEPRAAWWLYKFYADGVGSRVNSQSRDWSVALLGSRGAAEAATAQVLVGVYGETSPAQITVDLNNLQALPFLKGASQLRAQVRRIPDSGEAVVTAPIELADGPQNIRNHSARITIPDATIHEAYLITISSYNSAN